MTISTTDSRISYNGNGVTTEFSFPYRFLANGDLVVLSVSSAGVETVKAIVTDYTVTGAGDDAGGTVTMVVAPAVGTRLIVYRDTDIVQETDYISGDPFPAETHERALDRLTMIAQEIGSDADRAIKVPVGDSSSFSTTLPAAANRLDKFITFDASTGEMELSSLTVTQLASAVAAAYAAGSTADAVTYTPEGTGYQNRSVQARLRDILIDDDYDTFANAKTKADNALLPLFTDPTVNLTHEPPLGGGAVNTNGYLKKGLIPGHIGIGNGITGVNAVVGLQGNEYYTNPEQEVRGVSYVVRNARTVPDEPTLGWDFFGVAGIVTVEAGNTQEIIGNQKAVVGELYFNAPTTGTYLVRKAHNFQASAPAIGAGVTVTNWYGLVVNSPTGAGAITNGFGVYIEAMDLPTNKAAIRIAGEGDAGQIKWNDTSITQLSTNKLQINLGTTIIKEDSSGKLELDMDGKQLVLTDALVATTVGAAGGASALPATPQGYWRVLIGGVERKIPYYPV